MYLQQAELFRGLGHDFVREIFDKSRRESHKKGDFLFREGDRASQFYSLIRGRINLIIGETGQAVYTVNHAGECFGWSSLVGREVYSASAECAEPAELIVFDRDTMQQTIEKDPSHGLVFLRRVAGIIGNRLIQSYKMIAAQSQAETAWSFGTGQVRAESDAL